MHASAIRALALFMERDEQLVFSTQNMAKFWNVATRPEANNGLGLSTEEVSDGIAKLEEFFEVLYEDGASFARPGNSLSLSIASAEFRFATLALFP